MENKDLEDLKKFFDEKIDHAYNRNCLMSKVIRNDLFYKRKHCS